MVTNKDPFIVRLTWVDGLTLCGLLLSSLAACLAINGQFAFALSLLFVAMLADAFDGILALPVDVGVRVHPFLDNLIPGSFLQAKDFIHEGSQFLRGKVAQD